MSDKIYDGSAKEILKDPFWEDRFLKAYDSGVTFDETVIAELSSEADYMLEGMIKGYHIEVASIFKVYERWFKIDWLEGLTDRVESLFKTQPYEVVRREKKVTQIIVDWETKK